MPIPEPDILVETRGLTKRFGRVRAVDGVDLTVRRGEIFGLLGPNGAGKTTILRILGGLVRLGGGSASVFGEDVIAGHVSLASRSAMMIEGPGLHPNLFDVRFPAGILHRPE